MNEARGIKGGSEAGLRFDADKTLGLGLRGNYQALEIVAGTSAGAEMPGRIEVRLRESIAARGMTLAELAKLTGVSVVNLSVLKNGHARAIRFSTLAKLCEALDCQPGDLLSWHGPDDARRLAAASVATSPGQPGSRGGLSPVTSAPQAEAARGRAEAG